MLKSEKHEHTINIP